MPSRARPPLRSSLALVWRTLRSMRTALVLLLLLALASVAGSILPQIPNSPERVGAWLAARPVLGELLLRAGFFDVFGSWWFVLVTALLFVSLIACLVPRTRAFVRALRQPPVQARELDALRHHAERRVSSAPAPAVRAARAVLRRRGYRVAIDPGGRALAADKGVLREGGSLLFHWAFVLLLAAVLVGKGTGYAGRAVIVEGETWVDALANYDGRVRTGRFFSGSFSGIAVRLVDYRDAFRRSGIPMDFQSEVELSSADGARRAREIVRVNHPVVFDGVRLFQFGFGWAPVVRVEQDGAVVRRDAIPFSQDPAPEGISQLAMPWNGFVKIPSTDPPTAVELTLWPDGRSLVSLLRRGEPTPMVVRFNPVMQYTVWRGELEDLSLARLDTTGMRRVADGVIAGGQTVDLERGCVVDPVASDGQGGGRCPQQTRPSLTLTFDDLRNYSVLQVSRDPTVPFVLGAAILVLVGLLPALYVARRKLWVRVDPDGSGSVLTVGGFALQRKERFEEEFARLVEAIAAAAGGSGAEEREMVTT
ncbi:MAG: putative cytochrome C biogenesis protein ResB [Actinomycetota bacterium]|nr:MAG: putative cytochrome C biogenesis protein ResB [Actinomycetota bacterium]